MGGAALNLSWLAPDLALGGSFPAAEAPRLVAEHGVRAVIDLREEACDDRVALARLGVDFLHLPTEDHAAVSPPMLAAGVDFARQAQGRGHRLLIHCEHGIGRSALLALCVLTDRGAEPMAALRLAKARRRLVSPSPAQYHAWVEWLAGCRRAQSATWTIPDFDAFKAVAYSHLAQA